MERKIKQEEKILNEFTNWEKSNFAKNSLHQMGYNLEKIKIIETCFMKKTRKTILLKILTNDNLFYFEKIRIKSVNTKKGFNQLSKRKVDYYQNKWDIPKEIVNTLKFFTGEYKPFKKNTKSKERMFLNEMNEKDVNKLCNFFDSKKVLVLSDVLRGRKKSAVEWMIVVDNEEYRLVNMNNVLQKAFGDGKVKVTKRGSLKIGNITIQRMGGSKKESTRNYLQLKVDPLIFC